MQFLINFIELTYHYYILFYIIVYLIFILNLYFNNESSVNQKILKSIRVSWVKEDIFRSFIRLSIIISLFIPFHVINVVISETLTFFIFGWYILAPNAASTVFFFAHLQVIIEHFLVGSFIEKTDYAAPKTLVRIFKLVDLDFKTLVNTYLSLIHISEPTDQRGSRMPSSA